MAAAEHSRAYRSYPAEFVERVDRFLSRSLLVRAP